MSPPAESLATKRRPSPDLPTTWAEPTVRPAPRSRPALAALHSTLGNAAVARALAPAGGTRLPAEDETARTGEGTPAASSTIPGEASSEPIVKQGAGGYKYEQHADGTIVIVEAPGGKGVGTRLLPGNDINRAITNEIGTYPGAAEAKPASEEERNAAEGSGGLRLTEALKVINKKAKGFWDRLLSAWGSGKLWERTEGADADREGESPDVKKAEEEVPPEFSFKSQLDNEYGKLEGRGAKAQCNITTLAMQIDTLARRQKSDPKAALIALLGETNEKKKEELHKKQLEDLILEWFSRMKYSDWKKLDGKTPFYKGWYKDGKKLNDGFTNADGKRVQRAWFQMSLPLNYLALQLSGIVGEAEHMDPWQKYKGKKITVADLTSKSYFEEALKPALAGGAAVMLSTGLTGGHIVMLVEVTSDGCTINDPYGMRLAYYVLNGTSAKAAKKKSKGQEDTVKRRLKHNKSVLSEIEAGTDKILGNIGERNFYTWDEISTYKIGKWNNILRAAD